MSQTAKQASADLADFFDNAAVPLHWVGPDGTILRANRAELELLGYSEEEYVGRHIAEFHVDRPAIEDILARLGRGETLHDYQARLRAKDGSIRHVLISSNVQWDEDRFVHTRCFTRDITDRLQAEEALRESEERYRLLAESLEETDRRKDEFLATLAHELRNPLAPIRNAVQILRLAEGDPGVSEQAHQTIERQVHQMVRLVDDLLDLSRITRGRIELRKERVDLAAVVQSAIETSRPLVEAARHELTVSLPSEPVCLHADPTRVTQVIANLLNNAAKYTPECGHLSLAAERQGEEAVVRVRDDGVGIPGDELARVFEMFSQVSDPPKISQGGLGIGLTLVRRLVEMHGGTVEATSPGPGQGSEFAVRLPVAPAKPGGSEGEVEGEAGRTGEPHRRRVLVVDDNRDSADSLTTLLELRGNEVRTAYDGPAALAEAGSFRPDVVLLDIGMPGMSGHEVARRMRKRPELQEAVLVAVTGWGQEEDRRRSQEAGFDLHLTKPADLAALDRLLGAAP